METFSLTKLYKAFTYSLAGIVACFKQERAFRLEIILCVILTPLLWLFDITLLHRFIIIASMLLVLLVELLNSATEAVVDIASPQKQPLAKLAKDAGSAAVLIAISISVMAWLTILF